MALHHVHQYLTQYASLFHLSWSVFGASASSVCCFSVSGISVNVSHLAMRETGAERLYTPLPHDTGVLSDCTARWDSSWV